MSSFPQHVVNIKSLTNLGFDMTECYDDDGSVSYESWGYDELVDIVDEIVCQLKAQGFKVVHENKEIGDE